MKVLVTSPSLQKYDAVSNDVYLQSKCLEEAGETVFVYSEFQDAYFQDKVVSKNKAVELVELQDTVLIVHHSCYWKEGGELLRRARCKIIFRYHNITPPEFFPEDFQMRLGLLTGRAQILDFINSDKVNLYLGASSFNNEELYELGADKRQGAVVSPFSYVSDFEDAPINQELYNLRKGKDELKLLFVGRIIDHKGHFHLLSVLEEYIRLFGNNVSLTLVGKIGRRPFALKLQEEINRRKLGGHVEVVLNASFEDLNTYYRSSDVFLMMSEHEGYGVPLVEAQTCGLPVVCLNRTAVKETAGPEAVVIDELDYALFASTLNYLFQNKSPNSPKESKIDYDQSKKDFIGQVSRIASF